MLGELERGRVEALGDVSGLVDAKEEERYAARAFALQRREALTDLLERDAEGRGDAVDVVPGALGGGVELGVGHQDGSGEVVRQLDMAAGDAGLGADAGAGGEFIEGVLLLDEAENVGELEGPVLVIERF